MNRIVEELEAKLNQLDSAQANRLISLVRRAIDQTEHPEGNVWPEGYFEQTAGSFADEPLERSPQGEATIRDPW